MSPFTTTHEELQERIKELECLYKISSIIREHKGDIESTLDNISAVLKEAWRFPKKAVVELTLKDYSSATEAIPEKSVLQETDIRIFGNKSGYLKVHYPAPEFSEAYFLPEEQKLLNKAAEEIASFYEKQLQKDQEELLKRTAQRNDRLSILGEITAGIAHELNTPLGNILGFAELIEDRTENEQIKKDLGKIIKAAIYSREVVKKLMFFACEMPQEMKLIRVKPVITQALSLLGPNFRKAQVNHELQIENARLEAQLDPIQLTQVLFNLLINALYISPKNTIIRIKVYSRENDLYIEISDEGPGIKEEHRSKIFEPFFTTKPVGEGSGLGLSVVHGIIKSHRGDILTFDNNPMGTVFQIRLPLKS